ncbi:hypothetical protein C8R44DRAFT_691648, partial [Mycena epipterygia]
MAQAQGRGVKAECSNCGATHMPLWRRGLNDCNVCGLYCKLHKRPHPKTMRNAGGREGCKQAVRAEAVDIMVQCYNCHATPTSLWHKDGEGKTVCNACVRYYKLHVRRQHSGARERRARAFRGERGRRAAGRVAGRRG